MNLSDINIVLSNTTHPGNIGATARAMKTMGLSELVLVNPARFPSADATVRASRADDILEHAKVVDTIEEGIADSHLVIGTSARQRRHDAPLLTPFELAELVAENSDRQISVLFGTENSGLTNNELSLCHYQVYIPANPDYSSLNLASAVQLIAYEIRMRYLNETHNSVIEKNDHTPVMAELMHGFYEQLEQTMISCGYLDPDNPKQLGLRLRRMYNRMQPDQSEYQILRGFLTSIDKLLTRQSEQ